MLIGFLYRTRLLHVFYLFWNSFQLAVYASLPFVVGALLAAGRIHDHIDSGGHKSDSLSDSFSVPQVSSKRTPKASSRPRYPADLNIVKPTKKCL